MLDGIILWFTLATTFAILASAAAFTDPDNPFFAGDFEDRERASMYIQGFLQLLWVTLLLAYYTLMHGGPGWTVGKKAAGIRVVMLNGSRVTYKTAFLRGVFLLGPQAVLPVILLLVPNMYVFMVAAFLYWPYFIVNIVLTFADGAMQRSIQDRLAGTRVVRQN